ncbi:LysM peptidoglycan-binding domain-containing protein [Glutamicibacter sp. AOP12-B1-11]
MVGLLTGATLVILLALAEWAVRSRPHFDPAGDMSQNLLVLFLLGTGVLFGAYLIFYALLRAAINAARHGHGGFLELLIRLAPSLAHRAVGPILGTTLALSGTGIANGATTPHPDISHHQTGELASLPHSPETASAQPNTEIPTPGWFPGSLSIPMNRLLGSGNDRKSASAQPDHVVVASGQTLWSIANDLLNRHGSPAEIAELWPQIYELNRQVIGEDPNLLRLGIELQLPKTD